MSDYRCRNVIFTFDGPIAFITLNCDLELFEDPNWIKVDALVSEFHIRGLSEFRQEVINFVRGMADQDHQRRTVLEEAKRQLEAAVFTVN